jgi:hypothetical protein
MSQESVRKGQEAEFSRQEAELSGIGLIPRGRDITNGCWILKESADSSFFDLSFALERFSVRKTRLDPSQDPGSRPNLGCAGESVMRVIVFSKSTRNIG